MNKQKDINIGDLVRWADTTRPPFVGYVADIRWNHDEYEYYIYWFKLGRTRKHPKHVLVKVEE